MTNTLRRHWFRFSLRTMFIVVTIFGVWLGWQLKIVRERKAVLSELQQATGADTFSYSGLESMEEEPRPPFPLGLRTDYKGSEKYIRISTVRRLLGDETIFEVRVLTLVDPKLMERLEAAFPEAKLYACELGEPHMSSFRDSLYGPYHRTTKGTVFKTGPFEKWRSRP